ncbi:MAG: hypothetical protein ACREJX_13940 [Polyangiaceae bacterium]
MIACALCVGSSPEPYLQATLASIEGLVDLLLVNDNAASLNPNLTTIEASAFAREGRLHVVKTKFADFATMRNDAFAALKAITQPDWVLWLDADEVHSQRIAELVRGLLPRLGPEYGSVDGYTDHFLGSFGWIKDVARRFCAYRFSPDLRWRNAVHEKVEGLRGKAAVIPYRYAHYGNVLPPSLAVEKHARYLQLGSAVSYELPSLQTATVETVYGERAKLARRFHGEHPPAARELITRLERDWAAELTEVEHLFRRSQRPSDRIANAVRGAVEETRIALRYLEHPRMWPLRPTHLS